MQKQADDKAWLIFTTVTNCVQFVAYAAASATDPSNVASAIGSFKDIAEGARQLADPNLQPVLPNILTTLRDTTPAGAAAAWSEVSMRK